MNIDSSRAWTMAGGLTLCLSLVIAGLVWYKLSEFSVSGGSYDANRQIRVQYTVRNRSSAFLADQVFQVYAPLSLTSNQQRASLTASHDFELSTDVLGNEVMIFRGDWAPYSARLITIDAVVNFADRANPSSLGTSIDYLGEEELIELSAAPIADAARGLEEGAPQTRAQRIYDWVRVSLRDVGYVADPKGAARALREGSGDCTEYAYLFTAVGRATGIPVRPVEGFVVKESGVVRANDYHDWAEAYLDGAWRIVDAQQGSFEPSPQTYVAVRIVGPTEYSGLGAAHRYAVSHTDLEVRMN